MKNKILILGPQGSGKGTQAIRISQKLGIPALSMGQLLRDEVKTGSELAQAISSFIDQGKLVTDEMALNVLKKRLERDDAQQGYILDGYPRNINQYEVFKKFDTPTVVLVIEVPKEESLKRILHRAEIEHRKDDTPEIIEKRLSIYHELTEPVIEKYKNDDLVHKIDGLGTMEEVEKRVDEILNF